MKIKFQCNKCPQLNNPDLYKIDLPIKEDSYYEFMCDKGHENKYIVRNTKYGLLFESGISAFLDGYNREAVTGFAVALERFYEYVINLVIVCDNGFSFETLEDFKKDVKLSERLYGVFATIYFIKFKKVLQSFDNKFLKEIQLSFPKFDNKPVNFRNKVTHEGYIPTDEETMNYGIAVSKYIQKITEELIQVDNGALLRFMMMNVREFNKTPLSDTNVSSFFTNTFIGNSLDMGSIKMDFKKHLEFLINERNEDCWL